MGGRWGLVTLLLGACGSQAGSLTLTNGATIPGKLARIESGMVIWAADLIGEIKVPEVSISELESGIPPGLQLRESDLAQNCTLTASGSDLSVLCAGDAPLSARWSEFAKPTPIRERRGKITSSLTAERGNTDSDEIEIDASATWRTARYRQRVEVSAEYETKRDVTTNHEASLDYQFDFLHRDGWFTYARSEYRQDRFASLERSILGGVGIGRDWTVGPITRLMIQGGIDQGRFDLQDGTQAKGEGANLQWRLNHETRLWKLEFELFHEGEFAWVLQDSDLRQISTRSGVEIPLLLTGLIGQMRLDYEHIAVNIPGIDDTDLEWVFALGYKW
jgi:hypothetical protein